MISPPQKWSYDDESNNGPARSAPSNSKRSSGWAPIFVKSGTRQPPPIAIANSYCARYYRRWSSISSGPKVAHTIVGGPATILALGGFTSDREGALFYPLEEVAARLGACSEQETPDPRVAYARFERPVSGSFREEFLP